MAAKLSMKKMAEDAIKLGRRELIEYLIVNGYTKPFVNCENEYVRSLAAEHASYLSDKEISKLANDPDIHVRKALANSGHGWDKLINDPNPEIKMILIRRYYGLDVFANDEDVNIRYAVFKHGYDPEHFLNDEDENLRATAARRVKKIKKYEKAENNWYMKHKYLPIYASCHYVDPDSCLSETYKRNSSYDGYSEEYYNYN